MRPRGTPVPTLLLLLITGTAGQSASGAAQELCGHTWGAIDDEKHVFYKINVCENLKASECGGAESAICAHDINKDTYQQVGTLPAQNGNNVLVFNTTQNCPGSDHKIQSVINLMCGKSLGTPEFIKFDECVHYFEWSTFAACKKNTFKPIKEVPCYIFDTDYKKHDLNPLIKTSGVYSVDDWDTEADLYINICRTIGTSEGETSTCPHGSAACLIKDGKAYDVGKPKEALTSYVKDRLVLHYETESKPDFCNGHSPGVAITFICPSVGTEVTSPKLTANSNCRYEVEWVTENACHTDYLESDTCILNSKERGISIDLSPLKETPASPYHAEDPDNKYIYYLNVCGPTLAGGCDTLAGEPFSSCQFIKSSKQGKRAGSYQNQTLRYSDGTITLTYPGGEICSSGFQRMTVINFECNETAVNEGKGEPSFSAEADCTYFFSWETKYACPKKKEDLCHVEARKKHFNLFDLIRNADSSTAQNWVAVNLYQSDKSRYYINVCHEVLKREGAEDCEEDAAICAVDNSGQKKNLGKFTTPPRMVNGNILLEYTEGSLCSGKRIQTNITLLCSPGNYESPPVLKHVDDCAYNFEWHTAAACVLSKAEGEDCRVSDVQAGFYFDLSPLTKKNGSYSFATDTYDFYINVCGNVTQEPCEANSGACQVTKKKDNYWNMGLGNSKLSYYDGMIQLRYMEGTPYNDDKKTARSSLITFLCDREIDVGQPEYQKEDNYTYNFKWYTKYACPALPVECVVVDKETNEQYDLSSLSKVQGEHSSNWFAIDGRSKYYINVCRSLVPVMGCDPFAAVCQMENKDSVMPAETVAIRNLGVASGKPIIDETGRIIIEYINGSDCIDFDGEKTTYSSVVHLTCKKGSTSSSPIFISKENCRATFTWYTEAACPIVTDVQGKGDCSVENPNTGFVYHFESLKNDSGYIVQGNGKTYKLNICGPVKDCGLVGELQAAGCEFENKMATRPVKLSQSLELSTEGPITLTYHGAIHEATGQGDKFIINFVCNDDLYPGELSFKREEINTETHLYDTIFDFKTAVACAPAPVDCQVTDSSGNFYDLSDLTLDHESWTAIDSSDQTKKRTFYLNICRPVPYTHGCKGNAVGSCMKTSDNKSINLGVIQMSPQAQADGSLTIVYMSGDKCTDTKRYSTRINFQCDHVLGSPVFQEQDDCEYVFLWRTTEACPVVRVEGDNCQVTDPKFGYVYDLRPLGEHVVEVPDGEYKYQLKVCGDITESLCQAPAGSTVSSCQVKGNTGKLAGLTNQKLIYKDGLIMLNYTGGEVCHKKYTRTTLIMFHCDKTEGKPVFLKETPDCTYMFQWSTPRACPFKPVDCSFKDTPGNSYDLSPLSNYSGNWDVQLFTGSNQKYRINICMPLVPETDSCPHGAAACLIEGTKAINMGELTSSPKWENGVAVLRYKNGAPCPDGIRNRTTTIRFKCDLNKVDSIPQLITALENCDYNVMWSTAAACPLTINTHDNCQVTNPATGYLFDLSSLSSKDDYLIKDSERSIQINICGDVKNNLCGAGVGVCILVGGKYISAGKSQSRITYSDQVLRLVYEDGAICSSNPLLKHRSVFTFVCSADNAAGSQPLLVSFIKETCTWQFSLHTSLACEHEIKCSVENGTSIIDLSPLMMRFGNYEVVQGPQEDVPSDFYINICKPLNSDVDVKCPPGAAACLVTASGQFIDIGHSTSAPQIDIARQTISIKMDSPTLCDSDKQSNYSTLIIFHCNMGTDLGKPKFVQRSDCTYLFEWDTPLVCPDDENLSGCLLTDQQLQYTFNLSSLSGETFKTSDAKPYYIGVCSSAQNVPSGKCDGAVCLQSDNTAYSFGNTKQMRMVYRHQEDMIVLQYSGGDECPSTKDRRQSTILFKCDESAGKGKPVLLSETSECSAAFEWKTQLACLPRKLDCKFIMHHKTYDLRMLSSMTGSWHFTDNGNKYYLNLCQRVNQGPNACSGSASVCRESNGQVQVLGQVHTQNVTVKLPDGVVSVSYSHGDPCGKDQRLSTTIELKCANITGKPILQRFESQSCRYFIVWETRAACAVDPKEASMRNGIVHVNNGASLNLTSIYSKSYTASGDIRLKDQYVYEIQLSGRENSAYQKCNGASVCQVKTNGDFTRAVGTSGKAKYYLDDDDLDVVFSSNSKCGKDPTKNATSTIVFHCSQTQGEGRPEFLHETADCQYLFSWHTSAVCSFVLEGTEKEADSPDDHQNQYQGLSGRSQAVGAVLSILLVILVICLIVLLLYKKERRETVMYKISNCCRRSSNVSYKYTKINTEEEVDNETEWLMEEVSANHAKPHHENGHVRSVKADAFTSLHVDDLDSEDEVMTIPEVRIQSTKNKQRNANQAIGRYNSGHDENLIGIVNGGQEKTGKSRSVQHKKEDALNIASFHDDSDEDMLNI
ncbi:cation-independent mannose-6-phosphate receptor [Pseudophryne corroboree]|uniref:cation-independent mannose-6-phosphate receptor n=1 Tax=Pseudophryne corroboree TaxID=495146 RepID=UPI003081234D